MLVIYNEKVSFSLLLNIFFLKKASVKIQVLLILLLNVKQQKMDYFLICVILTTLCTTFGDAYGKKRDNHNVLQSITFLVLLSVVHINVNHSFFFVPLLTYDTYLFLLCIFFIVCNKLN